MQVKQKEGDGALLVETQGENKPGQHGDTDTTEALVEVKAHTPRYRAEVVTLLPNH